MVSIKRNMGLLFINCMMFVFFMGLSCLAMACPSGQAECCKGTTMSCCPHPGYDSKGLELSYDLSACMTISPINPDGPIVIEPETPIGPITKKDCTLGQKQYKPSGSCGTSSRSCCSDGTWSGWDAVCPTTKTCSASSKPTCSLTGGTCSYICTCNTSTGEWENCQKRQRCNVGYESVTVSNGICCQKSDGSGPRCAGGDIGIGYRWVAAGTNCWDKSECGFGCPSNLSDGLACSESEKGNWCSKWDYSVTDVGCDGQFKYRNGQGMCREYYCRG